MSKENKKYCYRDPKFPETIYLSVLLIVGKDDIRFVYPMKEIFLNLKSLQKESKEIKDQLVNKKKNPIEVMGVVVIKINLKRKHLLKKADWTEVRKDFLIDEAFRTREFSKMMVGVYQFYNVMVLPRHYDTKTKQWQFTNWLPILASTDDEKIHQIARSSEEQVDSTAKNVGIYLIEFIRGFDLDIGKLIEKEKDEGSNDLLN